MSTVDRLEILREKLDYKYIDGTGYFSTEYVLDREHEIDRLKKENKELQQRIDNAIEYINNPSVYDGGFMTKHDLLMLLTGIVVRSDSNE